MFSFVLLFSLAVVCPNNAIKLSFGKNSDYEIDYNSEIKVHTRNPDYYYTARKTEEQSLHIRKETQDKETGSYYEFMTHTGRYFSNVTEYDQEDRIFDSDTLNDHTKGTYPLFSNYIRYKIGINGELIEPGVVSDFDETIADLPGFPKISDTLPMELITSFYESSIEYNNLIKENIKKFKGILKLGHYHSNEVFNVLYKPKKQSKKNKENNELIISVVNGRLDVNNNNNNDSTIVDARLKGTIKLDVNTGMIKYYKINTGRDIEHPRIGLHWLYEEIIINIKNMNDIVDKIQKKNAKQQKDGIATKAAKKDKENTKENDDDDDDNQAQETKNEL